MFLVSSSSFTLYSSIVAPVMQVQTFLAILTTNWMNIQFFLQETEGSWTPFLSLPSSDVMKGWCSDVLQPLCLPCLCVGKRNIIIQQPVNKFGLRIFLSDLWFLGKVFFVINFSGFVGCYFNQMSQGNWSHSNNCNTKRHLRR